MATLLHESLHIPMCPDDENIHEYETREVRKISERHKHKIDKRLGKILSFSVADGTALYVVCWINGSVMGLRHIDWLDGYMVHPALIAGLTPDDLQYDVCERLSA